MSKPAFTPGRWSAVNRGSKSEPMMEVLSERISGQGFTHCVAICATGDSAQEMENANAHLISAAPDMYEALRAILPFIPASDLIGKTVRETDHFKAALKVHAALAKAEGRS